MSSPLKIHGRKTHLEGIHFRNKLELGGATIDVIGKVPDNRPYVSISNDRNETIATIDAHQMNGLVRRWMKATGWLYGNNKGSENYIRLKRLDKPKRRKSKADKYTDAPIGDPQEAS